MLLALLSNSSGLIEIVKHTHDRGSEHNAVCITCTKPQLHDAVKLIKHMITANVLKVNDQQLLECDLDHILSIESGEYYVKSLTLAVLGGQTLDSRAIQILVV